VRPVALLTDFGLADHYVGVLHAVLEREAPGARRIDLGHQVPQGDVWAGCFLLRCAWPSLPDDAVVLAVVDPGVGGDRRPVAVRVGGRWLVAPDNGLAAAAGAASEAVTIDWRRMGLPAPSATFHGRDLFAPAAARLARGDDPGTLGERVSPAGLEPCPIPEPVARDRGFHTTVVHVDRFGNLITNLSREVVDYYSQRGEITVRIGSRIIRGIRDRYGQERSGRLLALFGSSGYLEIACNLGSAAEKVGYFPGKVLEVKLRIGKS